MNKINKILNERQTVSDQLVEPTKQDTVVQQVVQQPLQSLGELTTKKAASQRKKSVVAKEETKGPQRPTSRAEKKIDYKQAIRQMEEIFSSCEDQNNILPDHLIGKLLSPYLEMWKTLHTDAYGNETALALFLATDSLETLCAVLLNEKPHLAPACYQDFLLRLGVALEAFLKEKIIRAGKENVDHDLYVLACESGIALSEEQQRFLEKNREPLMYARYPFFALSRPLVGSPPSFNLLWDLIAGKPLTKEMVDDIFTQYSLTLQIILGKGLEESPLFTCIAMLQGMFEVPSQSEQDNSIPFQRAMPVGEKLIKKTYQEFIPPRDLYPNHRKALLEICFFNELLEQGEALFPINPELSLRIYTNVDKLFKYVVYLQKADPNKAKIRHSLYNSEVVEAQNCNLGKAQHYLILHDSRLPLQTTVVDLFQSSISQKYGDGFQSGQQKKQRPMKPEEIIRRFYEPALRIFREKQLPSIPKLLKTKKPLFRDQYGAIPSEFIIDA